MPLPFAPFLLLAQQPTPKPDEVIGWAERISKGGVGVLSLLLAFAAVAAMVYLFFKLIAKAETFSELEKTYRATIEEKAKQDKADAEQRLKDAKEEAAKRREEDRAAAKERLEAEKESDAQVAHGVMALENCTKILEKVDKKLDQGEGVSRKLDEVLERLRSVERNTERRS